MKMKNEKPMSLSYFPSSSISSTLYTVHVLLRIMCVTLLHLTCTVSAASNEIDRIALLDFKHRVSGLDSWNESQHHCRWQGVSCSRRHGRVVALSLPDSELVGRISPQIGNLTFLREIDLSRNGLYGEIPGEIGRLFRLRDLNFGANALTGEVAALDLTNCSQLKGISFLQNALRGKLLMNFADLKQLEILNLGRNQFTGEIPPTFGNFSSLQVLLLHSNHLEGSIPHEIARCRSLVTVSFAVNNLTGTLPSAFFNMTSIQSVVLASNSLQGTIPSDIGDTMPNLERFIIGANKFHGTIPTSFPNASAIYILDISQNYFVGKVPNNIGMLKDLQIINLEKNLLGSSNDDLAFIDSMLNCSNLEVLSVIENMLQGRLPNTIANLSSGLTFLGLGENKLSGKIPIGLRNLGGLTALILEKNLLSGVIPSEIGDLPRLQALNLNQNQFSREIPSALFNLTSLSSLLIDNNNLDGNIPSLVGNLLNLNELNLSFNKLNGTIPEQVFGLPSLSKYLDLSNNFLAGPLSFAVGKLKTITRLDISRNKLSGKIPESLGDCLSLEYLDMHANRLEGEIPSSLVSLRSLSYLDFSNNKLTGKIPRELQNLRLLQHLNLSFNDLEGEVPKIGVFAKATSISLFGNKNLCGGVPELKLPPCPMETRRHRKHIKLLVVIFSCVALVFASFLAFLTLHRRKKKKEPSLIFKIENLPMVSYNHLHKATEGFSDTNLIGSGGFGSVYKGRLMQNGEQIIAVKVLDLLKNGASKSFLAECKVLKNIRHRNLVPIFTCCSSCDFSGNEFKALVYEFMENGDLDKWLHPHFANTRTYVLTVLQRLNIAIDVASALHYLHDDCEPPVIHCDLKPSNILLDKDLTAHVGDFGLSRLYSKTIEGSTGEQSSTIGLRGSIGYVPPEYGVGALASTHGDVYSYGILLLEMFTAKRPIDDAVFNDGYSSLREYVEMALLENIMKIVDPLLLLEYQESNRGIYLEEDQFDNHGNLMRNEENKMRNFFLSIFKLGLACTSRSPIDRAHMKDVTVELQKIKNTFFL